MMRSTTQVMKKYLGHINPAVVCCVIAVMLSFAYGIWGYLDFFMPGDFGCSGDPACIAEITAERQMDFVVVNIGMLFAFLLTFGGLLVSLGVFVAILDRWSWHT
jgi:hypothetical protein